MRSPRVVWAVLVGVPTALELWAVATDHVPWTLSPTLRWALRCETPFGRVVTPVLVGAGSSWLAHHLLTIEPAAE
jgi:hypothetical protein